MSSPLKPVSTPAGWATRTRRAVQSVALDISPLRSSHDFRLLYSGQIVNVIGSQVRVVALPYQVYLLTHSSLMVGLLSLAQVVPLVVFALIGGALADVLDRRKLLLVTQVLLAATSALLAFGAFTGRAPIWYIFTVAAIAAGISAFDQPARRAAIPRLVPREQLLSALALNQTMNRFANVAGPAVGGLVLATAGLGFAYSIDAVTFGAAIAALLFMAPMPPGVESGRSASGLRALVEPLGYLKTQPILLSAWLIDLNATILGVPKALFPALATSTFMVGAAGLGLLYAAPSAGGLIGLLVTGWTTRVRRQGLAVVISVIVWGICIASFGFVTKLFWLALLILTLAGAADMTSALFRNTIIQLITPDYLRGRISAIQFMVVSSGPRLGDLEAGAVAAVSNVQLSIISGGIGSMVGAAIIAFAVPAFVRYRALSLDEDVS